MLQHLALPRRKIAVLFPIASGAFEAPVFTSRLFCDMRSFCSDTVSAVFMTIFKFTFRHHLERQRLLSHKFATLGLGCDPGALLEGGGPVRGVFVEGSGPLSGARPGGTCWRCGGRLVPQEAVGAVRRCVQPCTRHTHSEMLCGK